MCNHTSENIIIELHQNPILPTDLSFFINFCQLSKFKINRIVFAGTFPLALKQTVQFEENLDTFHQPIKCISATHIAGIITAFKRQRAIIARRVLFCVDNG